MTRCFVQLGRYGDIMNVLPLVWEASRTGQRPFVMVGASFADLLDGCSYCIPDVWTGDWEDLAGAMKLAQSKYDEVLCTQVHSKNYPHNYQRDSYAKDEWAQIGRDDWGSLPLVFDLRNSCREAALWIHTEGRPFILVATHGQSSPFENSVELLTQLNERFGSTHAIVSLGFPAHRIYDLLGLYDEAACLVTIDTATMHLAHASKVPVIALHSDAHHGWGATPRYPGQVFRTGYHAFYRDPNPLLEAVARTIGTQRPRLIFHVWSEYERDEEAQSRHNVARGTWVKEYSDRWKPIPVAVSAQHTSLKIRDPRPVPFVNDIVGAALDFAQDDDLIVLCNEDIQFVPGLGKTIEEFRGECAWSNRRDFQGINRPVTLKQIVAGTIYPGTDFFVFTKRWWKEQKFQQFYIGRQQWDLVFRTAMQITGGREIPCATAHDFHEAYWRSGNHESTNPANRWNYEQSANWHNSKGLPVP